MIAAHNFVYDFFDVNFEFAVGVFALEFPWMGMLWFLFDGDHTESEMFQPDYYWR